MIFDQLGLQENLVGSLGTLLILLEKCLSSAVIRPVSSSSPTYSAGHENIEFFWFVLVIDATDV